MSVTAGNHFWQSPVKTVLVSGFVAGTLDILSAIAVYGVMENKTTAANILRYIASAVFKDAFTGGNEMVVYGLLFHFLIAFIFASLYFFLFPYLPILGKQKIVCGILYGVFVWVVMNIIVVPLVFSRPYSFTSAGSFFTSLIILILMIGLPVSLITCKHYAVKHKKEK